MLKKTKNKLNSYSNELENLAEDYPAQSKKLEELIKERTFELIEANENLQVEIKVRKQAEKKLLNYQKQLQSLSSQISLIEEREKRRIASELHDCIGQTLAMTKIKLELLRKLSASDEHKNIINEILQLVEQTIRGTRTLTFELSPPILYELGLRHAIQWLVEQFSKKHGITIEFEKYNGDIAIDDNIRFILFQAIRELLMNIVKHAQATKVKISMLLMNGNLKIVIQDDGIGFSGHSDAFTGYGLFNIRERMNQIHGHFEIRATHRGGTRATLMAPLKLSEKKLA
jgi:signal transduction histidine kinase